MKLEALSALLAASALLLACSKDPKSSAASSAASPATSAAPMGSASPPQASSSSSAPRASEPEPAANSAAALADAGLLGGDRPLRVLHVPRGRRPGEKLPLIVELHGYGADGPAQDHIMGLSLLVDSERFILAAPDGTMDRSPNHFWNATDTCCNFEDRKIDDVAYLRGLVREIDRAVGVDLSRVYAVGHSNGGSMAMRLACDAPDTFAAVVSIAGPGFEDETRCAPSRAVSVRHMHGTRDGLVPYLGGPIPPLGGHHPKGTFPSASTTAAMWARLMGCDATGLDAGDLDLDDAVLGAESHVRRFPHCKDGSAVELVTMDHVGHMLWRPTELFAKSTWDFLRAHQVAGAAR